MSGLRCFASVSRAFLPVCGVGIQPQLRVRTFSSTPIALAKISSPGKKKRRKRVKVREINPEAMPIVEAAHVLRASDIDYPGSIHGTNHWFMSVEASRPLSAYELHIKTQFTRGQAPLRGRIALPRDPRTRGETVLVFAEGKAAQDAREAGAAYVGGEELVPKAYQGDLYSQLDRTHYSETCKIFGAKRHVFTPPVSRFSLADSSPTFCYILGLMPAAKRGTVTEDVVAAIREAKGMLEWKGDKFGYVRAAVGRIHFPVEEVENNVRTFLQTVRDAMTPEDEVFATRKKAASTILQVYLSSTQGPGIELSDVGYIPYK
ncbi:ribosomal protein, partial [Rhizoctonia solani]